ncbi:MAG: DUF362 domain-containing protein [Candidatus Eremiobacteraeota bacterium]|nr:DUF362 domain-containing protein [Candidatus Eremiobacteraeota bacterium]
MKDKSIVTRRDFMKAAATTALLAAAGLPALAGQAVAGSEKAQERQGKARVVLVRNARAVRDDGTLDSRILGEMLDEAVTRLFQAPNAAGAWKKVVTPSDRVGIKSNVWKYLPTPPELVEIIKSRVESAGVDEKNVHADDRGARETLAASTALINVRPLRSHHWAGIGGCIKNYIMFVDNPSSYHDNSCASLGAIWNLPVVKGKTRLNILVLLTPQFYGRGPHHFDPRYVWPYKGIMVSTDPVALDALGAQLLLKKRVASFGENRPVTPVNHIQAADREYGIGVSDLKRIDLIKLGWSDEALL